MKKIIKYHEEKDSPFFRLKSKEKLANLLYISKDKLKFLANTPDLYHEFSKEKPSGGTRLISAPRDDLKAVQSRIADLLQRIAPPDYLFAPVARRSYVDNAARHLGAVAVKLLDIEDFFPSCTANKVVWFFRTRLECSVDVAVMLKGIVTRNDSLPQGSPCSPILAYLCYVDMWEEISSLVTRSGQTLSVYADDLTISGDTVPGELVWSIKRSLVKHGHKYNVSKERSKIHRPAEITGVILRRDRLLAPNRQLLKLLEAKKDLKATKSPELKKKLESRIAGRSAQLRQISTAR